MPYTADQLEADFRSDVFDRADVDDGGNARDTLWSSEDVLRYLNSAAARLASDTLALRRRFVFDVLSGDPMVRLPLDEVLDVLTASFRTPMFGSGERDLDVFDIDEGVRTDDYGQVSWRTPNWDLLGVPHAITRDYENGYARLYPIPMYNGICTIAAIVLPKQIYAGTPLPFPAIKDRDLLLLWMKKLAYEKQDADTLDLSRAKEFENQYRRMVLDRASEIDRTRRDGGIISSRL